MGLSIQHLVLQLLEAAASERQVAREERRDLRDRRLNELGEKADLEHEAENLQIDVNIDKSETGAGTAAFGAVGSIVGNCINIGIDETRGRQVGALEREAGLAERDAAAIQHDLEETRATERARTEEARQAYDAGVEAMDKLAEASRVA